MTDAWRPTQAAPVRPVAPVAPVPQRGVAGTGAAVLDDVRDWLDTYVCAVGENDLDLLTLWAAHTHLAVETYTTPRLLLDSPVPGSGKTTTLEHLQRLCMSPVQMASLSSPALLTRMLDAGMRTVLIDEADRSLNPDREGVGELLAVLNSGYKRGGTRPVLTPAKGGDWKVSEMPTFCPVAMAGNSPNLPDDTRSRSIRVLLMPDIDGTAEESDWEWIDHDARELGKALEAWADYVRDDVRLNRPVLPDGVKGRARERWAPLKRVADAAGGRWPAAVDLMAADDVRRLELEREEGIVEQRPHVILLAHIHKAWQPGEQFISTETLIARLVHAHPDLWGDLSTFGKRLTAQRLARMLSKHYNVPGTDRPERDGPRGYLRSTLVTAFRQFGLDPLREPAQPAQPAQLAQDRETA